MRTMLCVLGLLVACLDVVQTFGSLPESATCQQDLRYSKKETFPSSDTVEIHNIPQKLTCTTVRGLEHGTTSAARCAVVR